jgi:hypothetical protein
VTERGERPGLALEPLFQFRLGRDVFGEYFDSDDAVQPAVASFVDFTIPPAPRTA